MPKDSAAQNPKESYPQFSLANLGLGLGLGFGYEDKPLPPPPPCVEVLPSKDEFVVESNAEPIVITDGLTLFKGRKSTCDVFGVANSDLVPGKYEGGLKLWEGSVDLVRALHSEVVEGRLALEGKRVLEVGCLFPGPLKPSTERRDIFASYFCKTTIYAEKHPAQRGKKINHTGLSALHLRSNLQGSRHSCREIIYKLGCGHGLPGIFAGLKGAAPVHFQDFNAEVLQSLTIPNIKVNLKKDLSQGPRLLTSKSEINTTSGARFFAGDWSEIHQLLFRDCNNENQTLMDAKKEGCTRYDVILMAETVYALSALPNLYALIKKCLHHPSGIVYMAGKNHYFGVGGGTRQFHHLVEEDGIMAASVLAEVADGSSNVREVWKLSFK